MSTVVGNDRNACTKKHVKCGVEHKQVGTLAQGPQHVVDVT
jgi:hypothetical protein